MRINNYHARLWYLCPPPRSEGLSAYAYKYNLDLDPHFEEGCSRVPRKPWTSFITPDNSDRANAEVPRGRAALPGCCR